MRLRNTIGFAAAALSASCAVRATLGGVIETEDRDEWFSLVGPVITVDFLGFEPGEFITDQYADLGILFTDGNDSIFPNENSFPNDGVGLDGNGHINVSFDTPQLWIGVDYPGLMRIDLFSGGRLIYQSSDFINCPGAGCFAGLISSEFFDAARLIDPAGEAAIDDLHFGVPAPGTLALLALAGLFSRRRRRC